MSKKSGNDKDYINKPQNVKIAFYAVFMAAIFLFELYLMIYDSTDFILLGIIGFIFLIFLYLLINLLYQVNVQKEHKRQEQYENIFKSEKASYMLLRKNFDEINEKVNHLIDNGKLPMEEMIQAQKAIAKVTINRNKENANAMLNSNDRLLEQVIIFDKKLSELDNSIGERQKSVAEQSNKEVFSKQSEIASSLRELELTLKNEILKAVNDINSQTRYTRSDITYREEAEPIQRQASLAEEATPEFEIDLEPELPDAGYEAEDKIEYGDELSVVETEAEQESDLDIDIPTLEAEQVPEPDIEIEIPEVEEIMPEIEPEEAVPEELPPMPDLSNPNKVMSPDEISALFANTVDTGTTLEESTQEEVPEPPIQEEKPPMPDLSNPNKVMTPEEIAALLANM